MLLHESRRVDNATGLSTMVDGFGHPPYCWSEGDVALWDNRATQHIAVDDYGSARRIVRRTTVLGEIPVSVGGETSRAIKPGPESRIPRSEEDKLALKKAG